MGGSLRSPGCALPQERLWTPSLSGFLICRLISPRHTHLAMILPAGSQADEPRSISSASEAVRWENLLSSPPQGFHYSRGKWATTVAQVWPRGHKLCYWDLLLRSFSLFALAFLIHEILGKLFFHVSCSFVYMNNVSCLLACLNYQDWTRFRYPFIVSSLTTSFPHVLFGVFLHIVFSQVWSHSLAQRRRAF